MAETLAPGISVAGIGCPFSIVVQCGGSMSIILGTAVTGAKFTPHNHLQTGDPIFDRICRGDDIPVSENDLTQEACSLYFAGCRYFHYHARNFETREQTTRNSVYSRISNLVRLMCPDMLISFGASRNGAEVLHNIANRGEWERVSQAELPLQYGGAHFVTTQAAIELQVICQLERKLGRKIDSEYAKSAEFLANIHAYYPSTHVEKAALETNSTANGGNYGSSSPAAQIEVYSRAINARNIQNLLHEVEWVQFDRSLAMTRMAIERPEIRLGGNGRLNITILFGFSPRLRFPETYEEFKGVVDAARSLERDLVTGEKHRTITISVGAAVLPQHAAQHVQELDVGRFRGQKACALRRLAAWAAQPDSGVDILRSGMEDTPYELDLEKGISPTSNVRLCEIAAREILRQGTKIETDKHAISVRLGNIDHMATSSSRGLSTPYRNVTPARKISCDYYRNIQARTATR
ncbi:3-keto-5-aminohexanoate cleavage protein [Bradyrhizobium algeriense]